MKLNIMAFALTCGLLWGFGLFFITWWIIAFDGTTDQVTFIGKVYRGYTITAAGSFIGLVWAFFDGLVGGAIFAWLYNLLTGRKPSPREAAQVESQRPKISHPTRASHLQGLPHGENTPLSVLLPEIPPHALSSSWASSKMSNPARRVIRAGRERTLTVTQIAAWRGSADGRRSSLTFPELFSIFFLTNARGSLMLIYA